MYKIFVTFIVAILIGASIQQGPSGQFGLGGNQESSGSVAGSGIGSLIPGGPGVNGSFGLGETRASMETLVWAAVWADKITEVGISARTEKP